MVEAESRNQVIDQFNAMLTASGQPFKVAIVRISDVDLLEKNARFMPSETFQNLVANVKRDGGLTSVPFCLKRDGRYLCLSGNHRVKSAKAAGLSEIMVLYTDRELTREEQVAIQLSHNAIEGKDDPNVLKSLWAEIESVSLKFYSGLDDETIGEMLKAAGSKLTPVNLKYRTLSFVFLPEEIDTLDETLKEALQSAGASEIRLVSMRDFDKALTALAQARAKGGVKNSACAMGIILDHWHETNGQDRTEQQAQAPVEADSAPKPAKRGKAKKRAGV